MDIIKSIEHEQLKSKIPMLKVGDTVDENNLFTIDGLIEITLPESVKDDKPALGTNATLDKDNYTTRFFIKDTDAYVNKTHINSHQTASIKTVFNSWSEWSAPVYTKEETYLKLTQGQIVNDMMYYIFDFSLNAGETLKEIEKFVNLGKDTDPLDFFKSFELKNDGKGYQNYSFKYDLDISRTNTAWESYPWAQYRTTEKVFNDSYGLY